MRLRRVSTHDEPGLDQRFGIGTWICIVDPSLSRSLRRMLYISVNAPLCPAKTTLSVALRSMFSPVHTLKK